MHTDTQVFTEEGWQSGAAPTGLKLAQCIVREKEVGCEKKTKQMIKKVPVFRAICLKLAVPVRVNHF